MDGDMVSFARSNDQAAELANKLTLIVASKLKNFLPNMMLYPLMLLKPKV